MTAGTVLPGYEPVRAAFEAGAGTFGRALADQLDDEASTIGTIGDSADAREAVAAFLAKRPPQLSD